MRREDIAYILVQTNEQVKYTDIKLHNRLYEISNLSMYLL